MGLLKLKNAPVLEIAEGIRGRAVTAENVTVFHATLDAGSPLPEHSHPHEQVLNLLEGELELLVNGETFHMCGGDVFLLTPNVVHSGKAITDCKVIDVFYPVREDFKGNKFTGYTR